MVNLGAGSPPNRLTTINYGNDSGPLKLNGLEIDAGSIYDRAYANGPGGGGHHIVWFDGNNIQGRNIWYSNGTPNAAISILETSTVNGLAIAADNTGIHAVLAVGALLHSKSANGVTFDETVIDASSGTKLPSAAVGPDGSLHVVYFRGNNNLYHVWLKDGQWSSYSLISSPSNDFASRSPKATRLVFDREGRPNALIYHGDLRQITIATGTPAPATRLTIFDYRNRRRDSERRPRRYLLHGRVRRELPYGQLCHDDRCPRSRLHLRRLGWPLRRGRRVRVANDLRDFGRRGL